MAESSCISHSCICTKCLWKCLALFFLTAGCLSEEYLNYTWPDTGVGAIASAPCPCAEILGSSVGKMTRQCTVAPPGAEWSADIDLSNCETGLSQISLQLCEIALVRYFF